MKKTNYRLLELIREKYGTQFNFAQELGLNEGRLSRIINGHYKANDEMRKKMAEKLGCSESL